MLEATAVTLLACVAATMTYLFCLERQRTRQLQRFLDRAHEGWSRTITVTGDIAAERDQLIAAWPSEDDGWGGYSIGTVVKDDDDEFFVAGRENRLGAFTTRAAAVRAAAGLEPGGKT